MGIGIAGERRFLAEDERDRIALSHYPALRGLASDDLVELGRWLRSRRNRARDIVRERRRAAHRGRIPSPGAPAAVTPGEQQVGMAAKKQVFARALRRVNARIERLRAAETRERNLSRLREALQRKRDTPVHHPDPGRTAGQGMRPRENPAVATQVDPRQVGRVSQSVRDAQARRDDARAGGARDGA